MLCNLVEAKNQALVYAHVALLDILVKIYFSFDTFYLTPLRHRVLMKVKINIKRPLSTYYQN